jgi:hypothetical protein
LTFLGKYVIVLVGFILGTALGVFMVKKGRGKMGRMYENSASKKPVYDNDSIPVILEKNFKIEDYKTVSERLSKYSITSRPDFKWE